jgi:hypothetical protein
MAELAQNITNLERQWQADINTLAPELISQCPSLYIGFGVSGTSRVVTRVPAWKEPATGNQRNLPHMASLPARHALPYTE